MSGQYEHVNPFQFSTKYYEPQFGLNYYGYRFYSPSIKRWLNRDPVKRKGFEVFNPSLVSPSDVYLIAIRKRLESFMQQASFSSVARIYENGLLQEISSLESWSFLAEQKVPYLFCVNNPLNRFDYLGLEDEEKKECNFDCKNIAEEKKFIKGKLMDIGKELPGKIGKLLKNVDKGISTLAGMKAVCESCDDLWSGNVSEDNCLVCCATIMNLSELGGMAGAYCTNLCLK